MSKIDKPSHNLSTVRAIDRHSVLPTAIYLIIAATALNAVYFALRYAFGYGFGTFLVGPEDRFADLVKVALSFKTITWPLTDTETFAAWPNVYKDYLLHNPYGGPTNLSTGQLTHFHHPPLSQLLFTLGALLIAQSQSATIVLWIGFGIYLAILAGLVASTSSRNNPSVTSRHCAVVFLCLATYPAMLVFGRGNYNAGFSSILIAIFLVYCFGRRTASLWPLLALAVAINIRPAALIFLVALPLAFGPKESVRKLATLMALTIAIFVGALLIEQLLYPDYTIDNFLQGLAIYKARYIVGRGGDGGNASLWGLIKNSVTMGDWSIHYYYEELARLFLAAGILVALLGLRIVRQAELPAASATFVLVSLYVLLAPVTAEYHLLVFIAPLIVLSMCESDSPAPPQARIVFFASVIMMCPKNYIFIEGLSLQTIINPLVLVLALTLMQRYTATGADRGTLTH